MKTLDRYAQGLATLALVFIAGYIVGIVIEALVTGRFAEVAR